MPAPQYTICRSTQCTFRLDRPLKGPPRAYRSEGGSSPIAGQEQGRPWRAVRERGMYARKSYLAKCLLILQIMLVLRQMDACVSHRRYLDVPELGQSIVACFCTVVDSVCFVLLNDAWSMPVVDASPTFPCIGTVVFRLDNEIRLQCSVLNSCATWVSGSRIFCSLLDQTLAYPAFVTS